MDSDSCGHKQKVKANTKTPHIIRFFYLRP